MAAGAAGSAARALATIAAGCFWGVERTFQTTPGVLGTRVGYTGGRKDHPTYREVCTDTTGHAEAVRIEFDPAVITYDRILDVFFENHNPTQLNYQGPDHGTQYRSAIFYHDDEQKAKAAEAIARHQPRFRKPIVTTLEPAAVFWEAEEYHQSYLLKKGGDCH